jgi:hypothetical protein
MATTIDVSPDIEQPSERLTGYSLGLEGTAFGLYPKLVVRAGAETLVGATLLQTEGLKDGDSAKVTPMVVYVEACYDLAPKVQGVAAYSLSYETYAFTGPSQRDAQNGDGTRTDLQHLIGVGALYSF